MRPFNLSGRPIEPEITSVSRTALLNSSEKTLIIALFLLSFGAYFNALWNGFVYDDYFQVVTNPWIRDVKYLPRLFYTNVWEFQGFVSNYYRPMMHLFYMFEYHLFGLNSWGFHLGNILVHSGVSVLVYLITARLLSKFSHPVSPSILAPSFIAAILFAVHPIHTEAVSWVAGIPELAFTFFCLLSFHFYLRCQRRFDREYSLSIITFSLATLCKETALTLPILLFAYDYATENASFLSFSRVRRLMPYFAVVGAYLLVRVFALEGLTHMKRHGELDTYGYFINIFPLFSQYLEKLLLPFHLNAFYVFHPIRSPFALRGIVSILITLVFAAVTLFVSRRHKGAFFSLIVIAIPLLPVLYIPALGENTFTERYLYLSSFGFVLCLALAFAWLKDHRPRWANVFQGAIAITVGLYILGTVTRNPVWKDGYHLWTDTVEKSPDSAFARNELGIAYAERGLTDEATEQYQIALRLNPNLIRAYNNLGSLYLKNGWTERATDQFLRALALNPGFTEARSNLAMAYLQRGLIAEAIGEYQKALRSKPDSAEIHVNLGNAYSDRGWIDESIAEYLAALRINPRDAYAHNNLGIAFATKGLMKEALKHFRAAVSLNPDDGEFRANLAKAHENIDSETSGGKSSPGKTGK